MDASEGCWVVLEEYQKEPLGSDYNDYIKFEKPREEHVRRTISRN